MMLLNPEIRYLPDASFRRAVVFVSLLITGFLLLLVFQNLLDILGRYFLPYMLYFILGKAAVDIAIALMRRVKLASPANEANGGFQWARFGSYILIPALVVFAGAVNNDHPQTREIRIEVPRKSSTLKELRMVFASDFHLDPVNDRVLDRFVATTNALHPDIILIGGDMLQPCFRPNLEKLKIKFRGLKARYGIYASPGNEDGKSIRDEIFAGAGMQILEDRVEKVGDAFYLAGLTNKSKHIEDLLQAAPDDLPFILLKHIPTDFESISRTRVDLQLSGHTHNGELFPFNLAMPFVYELAHGIKLKRNTVFVVTSGVRSWGAPIKTSAFSEILYIKASFRPEVRVPRLL